MARQSLIKVTVDCKPGVTAEITVEPANPSYSFGCFFWPALSATDAEKLKLDLNDAVNTARSHNAHVMSRKFP